MTLSIIILNSDFNCAAVWPVAVRPSCFVQPDPHPDTINTRPSCWPALLRHIGLGTRLVLFKFLINIILLLLATIIFSPKRIQVDFCSVHIFAFFIPKSLLYHFSCLAFNSHTTDVDFLMDFHIPYYPQLERSVWAWAWAFCCRRCTILYLKFWSEFDSVWLLTSELVFFELVNWTWRV